MTLGNAVALSSNEGMIDRRIRRTSMHSSWRLAFIIAPVFACGSASAAELTVQPGADAAEKLTEALITAQPGDVVAIGAGRFELTEGLSLDVDNVTVRGAGTDRTVLSFKGQTGSGEGLL